MEARWVRVVGGVESGVRRDMGMVGDPEAIEGQVRGDEETDETTED